MSYVKCIKTDKQLDYRDFTILMKQGIVQTYHLWQLAYIFLVLALFVAKPVLGLSQTWLYIPLILALIPIAYEGIVELFEKKISTEFFLIIATGIAILGHEEAAITVVLIIMLIAHYIEDLIKERTQNALESLVRLIPTDVIVRKKEGAQIVEEIVPLESVKPGMEVVIKTGGRIAVDGVIVAGEASIQEAFLTGESEPLHKGPGEFVFAGTYIEAGSLVIEAQKVGENTFFGKISALLEEAGRTKAHIVRLTDRITAFFTPAFLIFITVVWLITRKLNIIITLLIFGSPLELALVTPLTLLAATVAAFRRGILVKGGGSLEYLAASDTVIFDKTGTLTMGLPEVVSIASIDNRYTSTDILLIAAIAEKKSGHVLARAILQEAEKENLIVPDPDSYTSLTGHGITIARKGLTYLVGNRHFIEAKEHGNIPLPLSCLQERSLTTFYVATVDTVLGQICLADRIRPEARAVIEKLKKRSISTIILLSGDKPEVAQQVASQLGIMRAYGHVMPDEKLAMLKSLQQEGHTVTMIGDGINDAPALRQAHVGIAIGGMGMEPAIQAADIVLMSENLDEIIFLFDLAHATMRTVKQNLIIGFALTHTVGIILALLAYLTPIQAALFHAVPDFLILLNAARLVRFKAT